MAGTAGWIRVRGARVHNLQNLDVDLPRDRLTVITGPSGSGKSSLAFDTLYAEGQRRYLETLRADTRALFDQLQRPDVDLVEGLPPTLSVSQHSGSARPRSTLATITEIHDHLRLLWARLGIPYCYRCGTPIQRQPVAEIVRQTLSDGEGRKVYLLAPLVQGRKGEHKEVFQHIRQLGFLRARVDGVLTEVRDNPPLNPRQNHTIELVVDRLALRTGIRDRLVESLETAVKHGDGAVIVSDIDDGDWHDRQYSTRHACPKCGLSYGELEPRRFSFNNPYGACPTCTGLGQVWEFDPRLLIPDRKWSLSKVMERIKETLPEEIKLPAIDRTLLQAWSVSAGKALTVKTPLKDWPEQAISRLLRGSEPGEPAFLGLIPALQRLQAEWADRDEEHGLLAFAGYVTCPECGGARLNKEARSVRFAGKAIHEVTALSVDEATDLFESLLKEKIEPPAEGAAAVEGAGRVRRTLVTEICHRLRFLKEVGLGYLTLDRPAPTLSGGEAQRARLATHLGGGLLGVCYILDEPTIGLHPRDTHRLIAALRNLQQRGNTVLVVEHDETVIRQADYLVDIGPQAGRFGGRLMAAGTVEEVLNNPQSVTAPFLKDDAGTGRPGLSLRNPGRGIADSALATPGGAKKAIKIVGARHHNLKAIHVTIPLGRLVCVTGVSGSGKSSLVQDILANAAKGHLGLTAPPPGSHERITGLEHIDKVIEVDQSPLGRSSRSGPATYTGIFDEVRKVFAETRLAKVRGYKANRFSFNVKGGRCEECLGQGFLRMALQFLPDLNVPCPVCHGKRFNRATLEVTYRGRSIADVLDLPVSEALEFFANIPSLVRPLQALADVGLGYLALGQPSSALSGGEAQRVKLAAELARSMTGRTLILLDEPTTGLHFADVDRLLEVFRRLVATGNTLVVIEHHLDVIATADWIIDLGPEGGAAGGYLVASGSPREVAGSGESVTGRFLRDKLKASVEA
jgi:excinuclease ABC subunit A